MADKPGTGAPGLFQPGRIETEAPPVDPVPAPVPVQQQVQLLGLISRIQLIEGQLSALRREKLLGESKATEAELGAVGAVGELNARILVLSETIEKLRVAISQIEGIIETTIRFIETESIQKAGAASPGTNNVAIGVSFAAGEAFIGRIIATLRSTINFPIE